MSLAKKKKKHKVCIKRMYNITTFIYECYNVKWQSSTMQNCNYFCTNIITALGCYELYPQMPANLINVVHILTSPLTSFSRISLPLLWLSYSLRHKNVEIGPINNSIMASKCSTEQKSFMSLALNQKRKMIKVSEKSMSKAKINLKLIL